MAKKVKAVTEKEHMFLTLKYGENYAKKLYRRKRAGHKIADIEKNAACVGKKLVEEEDKEIVRYLSAAIGKGMNQDVFEMLQRFRNDEL